jgi:hypothetical protein
VRRGKGAPLLQVGDLTYGAELLESGRLSGVGDRARLRTSTERVRRLQAGLPGLALLAGHAPGAAGRLRRANGAG